ncbi:CopG family transcriptional regulator [Haloprofundus marisrubri]|uniref:CopG family transcriptional regulator n=1 Tax=Haloprofundus marisrubri TaxID=1514971 RepID=A0A0W1RC62_9EURY|nr:zinc-ribbon domain-containing protein [Haloprofundus marisrubri]KTG10970.1 CopG family transcriptional regulator [Haloprofundus marisrubri]
MSKVTFRADDDLVERLEALDASKSEVMREALRAYLDASDRDDDIAGTAATPTPERIDDLVRDRVDELVGEYLRRAENSRPQDVNVNISLDGAGDDEERKTTVDGTEETDEKSCSQCGEELSDGQMYCPNCGEKASRRLFCDCGDEVRSDWAFCPGCGRRTPAADVLERR